ACRAAAGAIPVLLRAPAAGGRLLLARALHALAGREGSLVVATGRRPALDRVPAGATLYLDAAALAPDGALALEALLDDARVWVLAGVEPGAALPGALGARLSAVVLTVPPLAARAAELPALAAAVVEGLGRRLGIAPPRLAADALERLGAHAWPGDLAELEAALARALLLAGGGVIEAAHLDLGAEPPAAVAAAAAAAPGGAALEYLLAELAHELRNPLVTIKTFADHLPALLEDAELPTRSAISSWAWRARSRHASSSCSTRRRTASSPCASRPVPRPRTASAAWRRRARPRAWATPRSCRSPSVSRARSSSATAGPWRW